MVDRIGERRRCADNANLADALRTKWVDQPVLFRNHDDVNLANVGVHGNHVVSQVGVDVSGCPGSISVCSRMAEPMPQIMPPMYWLCAVRGLKIRPDAKAPTILGTRISRVRA